VKNAPTIFNPVVPNIILFKAGGPTALGWQLGPIQTFLLSPVTGPQKDELWSRYLLSWDWFLTTHNFRDYHDCTGVPHIWNFLL